MYSRITVIPKEFHLNHLPNFLRMATPNFNKGDKLCYIHT